MIFFLSQGIHEDCKVDLERISKEDMIGDLVLVWISDAPVAEPKPRYHWSVLAVAGVVSPLIIGLIVALGVYWEIRRRKRLKEDRERDAMEVESQRLLSSSSLPIPRNPTLTDFERDTGLYSDT